MTCYGQKSKFADVPSEENATDDTKAVWPFSSASTLPCDTCQIWTVLSSDPETTQVPFGAKATDKTKPMWLFNSASTSPVIVPSDNLAAILGECNRIHTRAILHMKLC